MVINESPFSNDYRKSVVNSSLMDEYHKTASSTGQTAVLAGAVNRVVTKVTNTRYSGSSSKCLRGA